MITFSGEVSDNAKLYKKKVGANAFMIGACIFSVIFCIPVLLFCIYCDWLAAMFFAPFAVIVIAGIVYRFAPTNISKVQAPFKVEIMPDIMLCTGKTFEHARYYDDVKKVIDCGEWYHMVFYMGQKNYDYICQKDLITEGTIEEFEEYFKDKLVRKLIRPEL
ncbi:MAG: hypothetical protein K2M89_03245 [Clostridiales bacterium]|nr:hypothetical protein [Clostridiales bacterium]